MRSMLLRSLLSTAVCIFVLGLVLAPAGWAQDTTPPQILEPMILTPEIDTSIGNQTIRGTVRATDDLAGVTQAQMGVVRPSDPPGSMSFTGCTRLTGDALDGTYECERVIAAFSEAGSYAIFFRASDSAE